jgi:hypothetical protein
MWGIRTRRRVPIDLVRPAPTTGAPRLDDHLPSPFSCGLEVPVPALAGPRGAAVSATQNRWPPMGQLLVERGHVTSAQLEAALTEQQETGERLGEILVKHEHISRFDLASALSTQWSWKDEAEESAAAQATTLPSEQSVEPDPAAAPSEDAPLPPNEETPAAQIQWPAALELGIENGLSQSPPATNSPPEYLSANGAPASVPTFADLGGIRPPSREEAMLRPAAKDAGEPAPLPVGTEAFAALAGRVSGLEDQDSLLQELRTHLRETREQVAAGEARLGALEAILAEFSQTYAALNARLDAQTRELEDLRRLTADQAMRITTAGRALLG